MELSELIEIFEASRESGFNGSFEEFKYLLRERPELLPLPDKLYARGGMVNRGLGALMYGLL
ncbi:hypothetical protein OAJ23_02295 [Pelagibacteraceae bacterium]|jgi:hypothetical protein|nr:hypothetical protein [Pelagibacteraceae bacterium]|tara:strand:+ start:2967 stop:3152 length:186 start_codon:yes stop_codon:yes gene_type:complete